MDHQTFAQLLGNYGEFLGAIAVVATLVYVAIQVRYTRETLQENSIALRRSEMLSTYEQHDRYRLALLNPETADLWTKSVEGEKLSDADELRFSQLAIMLTYSAQNNWDAAQRGVMESEEWQRVAPVIATFYQTPGGSRFWKQYGPVFQPGFVAEMERRISDGGVDIQAES